MSNKVNIFQALPLEHSDDEDHSHQKKNDKKQNKNTGNRDEKSGQAAKQSTDASHKAHKDDHKKHKATPEPGHHTSERHSGTGQPAFDKKSFKKGGYGKGNVGKPTQQAVEEDKEEETTEETVKEEEKPAGLTLEEYYAQAKVSSGETQVDEAKLKSTKDALMKELLDKKATIYVPTRKSDDQEVKQSKKKQTVDVDHHAALTSDHSELLNFRTGFIEKEFRERGERGERPAPVKREAPAKKEEGEKTEEQPAEEVAEGEAQEEASPNNQERKGGNRGGYRGGNKGSFKGNKGGNRPHNNGGKATQVKINFEDESAFPKLG